MKIKLSEEAKAARREYHNRWRQNNPEKVRQYQAQYFERLAKAIHRAQTKRQ